MSPPAIDRRAKRLKVLRVLENRPHRYRRFRVVTMAATFAVLFAIPLFGLARFDVIERPAVDRERGGRAMLRNRKLSLVEELAGALLEFGARNQ